MIARAAFIVASSRGITVGVVLLAIKFAFSVR
jgi:hypothetical protein